MVPVDRHHHLPSLITISRNNSNKLYGTCCAILPTLKSVTTTSIGFISCMLFGSCILLLQSNTNNNNNPSGLWNSKSQGISRPSRTTNDGTYNIRKKFDFSNYINDNDHQNEHEQCRYYLAESAIPDGGLGLFTTKNITDGDEAQSMADICIYVADTPYGNHFHTHSWAGSVFMGRYEGENSRGACEGVATLVNTMPDSSLMPVFGRP